jgi:hypothetical protein
VKNNQHLYSLCSDSAIINMLLHLLISVCAVFVLIEPYDNKLLYLMCLVREQGHACAHGGTIIIPQEVNNSIMSSTVCPMLRFPIASRCFCWHVGSYLELGLSHSSQGFFVSWWSKGLNSELCACKAGHCTGWATPPVHFAVIILKIGLTNYFPRLASNLDPPYLSLPNG